MRACVFPGECVLLNTSVPEVDPIFRENVNNLEWEYLPPPKMRRVIEDIVCPHRQCHDTHVSSASMSPCCVFRQHRSGNCSLATGCIRSQSTSTDMSLAAYIYDNLSILACVNILLFTSL